MANQQNTDKKQIKEISHRHPRLYAEARANNKHRQQKQKQEQNNPRIESLTIDVN